MSKIALPALYQTDTSGSSLRRYLFAKPETGASSDSERQSAQMPRRASGVVPARSPDFLVQLMVGGDQDLRKVIGRRDVAERREAAYGAAYANRPSRKVETAARLEVEA